MKKIALYAVITGMIFSFCACQKAPRAEEEETTTKISVTEAQNETQAPNEQETKPLIQPKVQPNERTTHHETDVEKDRLLAFLNNEILLRGYPYAEPGTSLY